MSDFMFWNAILLLPVLWMVVRIWPDSKLLAVGVFFITPLAIVPLVRNWGRDNDIRLPFALAIVPFVFGMQAALAVQRDAEQLQQQLLAEVALGYSDAELEEIRHSDPVFHEALIAARDRALADDGGFDDAGHRDDAHADAPDAGYAVRREPRTPGEDSLALPDDPDGPVAGSGPAPQRIDPAVLAEQRRHERAVAAGGLAWRFGRVALASLSAELRLPAHFRFAPRSTLPRLARLRGIPLPDETLGWVVHDRSALDADDGWFIELRRSGTTASQVTVADSERLHALTGATPAGDGPFAPQQVGDTLVWGSAGDSPRLFGWHRTAAGGVLLVAHTDGHSPELGLRALRLLARGLAPARDELATAAP